MLFRSEREREREREREKWKGKEREREREKWKGKEREVRFLCYNKNEGGQGECRWESEGL